jgi:DNA-binding response OmpR family regulator
MDLLIVEDEEVVGLYLREELAAQGFAVHSHSVAESALESTLTTTYAAAIIDIGLPDLRGDELARRCRQRHPTMPIIFATGMNSRELHSQFANDHHISVLEKPFEASILLDELSRHGLPRCA